MVRVGLVPADWRGIANAFKHWNGWGNTCRAHRRFGKVSKGALDILDERHARREIAADEYGRVKADVAVKVALILA